MDDDAVRLFVDRAAAVQPGFVLDADNAAAVADICRRLDGIPLAIELAAARTSVLHPREIASRLDDRFALLTSGGRTALSRQRTLEASVDWSYDLLTDAEREVLRRLAVFVGTFSLDGARAVCERDVLDTLGSLVAKSLVTPVDVESLPRYRLLDTIRYYAHRKLVDAGQLDDALAAHLAYYRALSARIAAGFWTDANLQTIRTASAELGNIHAATDHALRAGDGLAALEAGVGVWSCLSLVGPRLKIAIACGACSRPRWTPRRTYAPSRTCISSPRA
jgi:predicted ATPase